MSKKAILVITDGIGYSAKTENNAFFNAKKPTYDKLFRDTPHSLIDTFGLSVGLPEGQMGNSEVGHMSIGSGRVLYQDLVKISLALSENRLESNPESALRHASIPTIHRENRSNSRTKASHLNFRRNTIRPSGSKPTM